VKSDWDIIVKEMNTIAKDRDDKTMWGLILLAIIVGGLFHFLHLLLKQEL